MKRYLVHFIVLVLVFVSCTGLAIAAQDKDISYPGQELLGTWRIVEYDMSDFEKSLALNNTSPGRFFLGPGQLIKITFDGVYINPNNNESIAWLDFETVSPISDWACQFGLWKKICKEGAKNVFADVILDAQYGVKTVPDDVLKGNVKGAVLWGVVGERNIQHWPDASSYEYALFVPNTRVSAMNVRILKSHRLLVIFSAFGIPKNSGSEPDKSEKKMLLGTIYSIWERVTPSKKNKK